MSDTPIAERLADELGMSWPLRPPRHEHVEHMAGVLDEDSGPGALGPENRLGGPEGCGLAGTGPHPLADWYRQRGFDGQVDA